MALPREQLPECEHRDYPLWLLLAVKNSLFSVCEDPQLEDARHVLEAVDVALAAHPPTSASQ